MGTWEDAGLIQADNQAKWNAAQLTTGQLLNKKVGWTGWSRGDMQDNVSSGGRCFGWIRPHSRGQHPTKKLLVASWQWRMCYGWLQNGSGSRKRRPCKVVKVIRRGHPRNDEQLNCWNYRIHSFIQQLGLSMANSLIRHIQCYVHNYELYQSN